MQRVVDARKPEQLDLFVPGSQELEARLTELREQPHYDPDVAKRIADSLASLRKSPMIFESTVDAVTNFVDTTSSLTRQGLEPIPEHAQLVSVGARTASTVCRFEGVPDTTRRTLYNQTERIFMWLSKHREASTTKQRALAAADVALIHGHKADISASYPYLDDYMVERRATLPRDLVTPVGIDGIELNRTLVDLTARDCTTGSLRRLRRAHAAQTEVIYEELGVESPSVSTMLELCLEVGILKRQWKLIPRIVREAQKEAIVPTESEVRAKVRPELDRHREKVYKYIIKALQK